MNILDCVFCTLWRARKTVLREIEESNGLKNGLLYGVNLS